MTDYVKAAALIGFFESFSARAYWDVNHYRLGFGSDTEGPDQVPVTREMTTTRARALANLQKRIPQYEATIVKQIGQGNWDRLGDNTRAALLSFTYNYGDLTETLAAVASGSTGQHLSAIVAAVEARAVDNHAVNAKRRFAEAAMIASEET
jgi:GH24 family phage-related lysozyme (muramidase)